MIRMLRSPLKREEAWLNALLKEHVVCYVHDSRRKWQLVPAAFELDRAAQGRYDSVRGSRPGITQLNSGRVPLAAAP